MRQMIGLGRILAEAREAQGVTLEEVERETRISRRYLQALEDEEFSAFPAQVQARGFLRVYAQYLELDAAEMLALFPRDPVLDETDGLIHADRIFREPRPSGGHLPKIDVRRPSVIIPGAFAVMLLLCGLVATLLASHNERTYAQAAMLSRGAAGNVLRVPDVRNDELPEALEKLSRAGITPLVIEVTSDRVGEGLVISQSPPPGAAVRDGSDVTLIVSRGRQ